MKRGVVSAVVAAFVLGGVLAACEQPKPASGAPSAAEIMAGVAVNQDRAEAERAHYVYLQHSTMSSRRGSSVMCEEVTDYRITPSDSSMHDELVKLDGRLRVKGDYVTYHTLAPDTDTSKW
jgi:hypothetical protein